MDRKINVLVVGGGFGGIKTALELSKDKKCNVTLLSDRSYFRYYPTLYHAATGGSFSASQIPLEDIFAGQSVNIVSGTATKIDRAAREVICQSGHHYEFDQLVLSLGVVTNYFGIKGLEQYAYGIKSVEEAKRLKNHLHKLLLDEGKPDLNYVIIGGGPTGVELAGALPGYLKHIMQRHGITKNSLHIDLVEAAPRLMPRMPKAYSRAIARHLKKLGVTLSLGQKVEAETADQLMVSGHPINSHTVVWTAGVANHPFFEANGFTVDDHHKVTVDTYLRAADNIYVIGDNASTPYSGMAQTALYDAKFVANNIKRSIRSKKLKTYQPKKPIYVTPAGPGWAAVLWGKLQIYGRLGWMLRSAADLIGYRDYEPWWRAGRLWLAEMAEEDDCAICAN